MMEILISLENINWMTLRISIVQISMTAMEDQYYRIRMVDNIKINIQHVHGFTATKLAHCFRLALVVYNFPSFSGLHQVFVLTNTYWLHYYPAMQILKFFAEVRVFVNINVFFCFTATTVSTWIKISVRHCNVNGRNATSASL